MLALVLGGVLCMIVHHLYYHHLDSKPPTLSLRRSSLSTWLENQTVVSDIGLALAYTAQTLFIAAVAISSSQLFWRSLRSRAHTVARIDALMKAQVNPFTPSSIRAARALIHCLSPRASGDCNVGRLDLRTWLDPGVKQYGSVQGMLRQHFAGLNVVDNRSFIRLFISTWDGAVLEQFYPPSERLRVRNAMQI